MKPSRSQVSWVICLLICALLAGCTRDPSVLKRRYFQKGEDYFRQGKYPEALIEYSRALQYDPEYAEAHYGVARCYLKSASYSAAYAELARTVALDPNNLDARLDAATLALANGNPDAAQKLVDFVLQQKPNDVPARLLIANVMAAEGQMDEALKQAHRAIELDPTRSSSYISLAIFQANSGQIAPAEASFKQAIALDPKSIAPLMAMGEMYEQLHRGPEAEDLFRRAASMQSSDPRPPQALVRVLVEEGKADEAEKFLQQVAAQRSDKESLRQLADFYIQRGDLARATFQYGNLHQKFPSDLKITKSYIQLLIFQNRIQEADELNQAILKYSERDSDALILKAQILMARNQPADAAELMDKLIQEEPENALAHHELGMALEKTGNHLRAETEWREAARLRPGLLQAQLMLAQSALQEHNYDILDRSVGQLIAAQPSSPRWYVYRAAAEIQRGDFATAEQDLRRAMQVGPQNPMAFSKMGVLRRKQKRDKEAIEFFENALQRDPAYFEALAGLSDVYMDQKKPDVALQRVKAQIGKVPNNTHFDYLLGSLYMRLGDKAQAESAFKSAVAADGSNTDALIVLAQLYFARNAMDDAIHCYEQAIRANPNDPRAYVLMGSVQQFRGNFDQAEELYQKALRVRPDYPMAANNLAYLMLERGGNLDMAASLAQVAHKGMPDSAEATDTLGWAYYKKGVYDSAIDLLSEAVKKEPNDAGYQYHLGLAYQAVHDQGRARMHLQRALQLDPRFSHASEIQEALKNLERS